jgi:iron complex transport system substrate-binding protein
MRVCSFLPSATEILFAIGAAEVLCGVTFECDYPAEAKEKPQVVFSHLPPGLAPAEIDAIVSAEGAKGKSLYFVDMERLEALQPDLIVLQDLCRVCAIDSPTMAKDLGQIGSFPRLISLSSTTIEGVFSDIQTLGNALCLSTTAHEVVAGLRARVEAVRSARRPERAPRVLCLEWLDPPFQGGHWIPEMVEMAGGVAVLATAGEKSVRFRWEDAIVADPEIVVVMPCGYHLRETVEQYEAVRARGGFPAEWEQVTAVQEGRVYAVDGTAYFSRPGPRLVDGLEILRAIVSGEGWEALPAESVEVLGR